MKQLVRIETAAPPHWVGDGFPVRTALSYRGWGATASPFLLLDYAGPAQFPPADAPRGVEQHPHRGFETVTIVYSGEIEHRDSAGGGGKIGPGDVQWMTAGSGLVHEEMHSREFTRAGGTFEVAQLWVNLPAKDKRSAPRYQTLAAQQIPLVRLPDGAGALRVIAGDYRGQRGPATTFTPIELFDLRLAAQGQWEFALPEGRNALLFLLSGQVELPSGERLGDAELAVYSRQGQAIGITALADSKLLLLAGAPIDEPIVGAGPFVMNSRDEIEQAFDDFRQGRMGRLD